MHRLLAFLASERPTLSHDWTPADPSTYCLPPETIEIAERLQRDAAFAASALDQAARIWQRDRERYPGWLVCPGAKRQKLDWGTAAVRITAAALDALTPARRAEVFYGLAWRY